MRNKHPSAFSRDIEDSVSHKESLYQDFYNDIKDLCNLYSGIDTFPREVRNPSSNLEETTLLIDANRLESGIEYGNPMTGHLVRAYLPSTKETKLVDISSLEKESFLAVLEREPELPTKMILKLLGYEKR